MGDVPSDLEQRLLAVTDLAIHDELLYGLVAAADPEAAAAVLARLVP